MRPLHYTQRHCIAIVQRQSEIVKLAVPPRTTIGLLASSRLPARSAREAATSRSALLAVRPSVTSMPSRSALEASTSRPASGSERPARRTLLGLPLPFAAGRGVHIARPSLPPTVQQRNQRLMVIEGIGIGVVNGVATFLPVFLIRLGAGDLYVGLLNAMPSLTGMLLAMPVGEFLARRSTIVPWYARARLLVQLCYVLTGLVPFLFAYGRPQVIIAIWAAATVPQIITGVALTAMMNAVAGPGGRFGLASKRWALFSFITSLTAIAAGQVLRALPFPLNYQIVFIASALGGLIGYSQASRIQLPTTAQPATRQRLGETLREYGAAVRTNRRFVRFTAGQFVYRWGLLMPVPLLPIYWVRNVHATDASISVISAVQTSVTMVAYFFWNRMARPGRERKILMASCLGLSFYPLLTAITPRVDLLVVWAAMAGFFAAGVDLVFFDSLLATCPAERQTTYVGMYLTTVYVAGLLSPLVGTALSHSVGIVFPLVLSCALRLLGFFLMWLLGVGKAEPQPAEAFSA
jgi:hypothetical protein